MRSRLKRFVFLLGALSGAPSVAAADEGGVSFWIPGFFGSLAAAPQQPGWSLTTIDYHTSVSGDAGVAIARERDLGHIPVNLNLSANLTASLSAQADLNLMMLTYTPKTTILGGQASFGLIGIYGRVDTSLGAQLSVPCQRRPEDLRWAPSHFRASIASTILCGASETCFQSSRCAGTQASTTTWST